jgi:hypothetical protein
MVVRISFSVRVGGWHVSYSVVSTCLRISSLLVMVRRLLFSDYSIAEMPLYIAEMAEVYSFHQQDLRLNQWVKRCIPLRKPERGQNE